RKGHSSSTIDVEADIKTNKLVVLGCSGFLGSAICNVVAANHFMIICQMPIMDKVNELGTLIMGTVESGSVHEDDNLLVMPNKVRVLAIYCNEARVRSARPGENLRVRVSRIEVEDIRSGFVLSSIGGYVLVQEKLPNYIFPELLCLEVCRNLFCYC
ncbi:translation elongation factor EF1A/initiation factor IF2gamma family protein isoform 4, partial [Tanacetum coccineum]